MTKHGITNLWRRRRASARALNDVLSRIEPPSRFDLMDWRRSTDARAA